MASKKSLYNGALVRHGLLIRFWPLMVVYLIVLVLFHVLPVAVNMENLRRVLEYGDYSPMHVLGYRGPGAAMSVLMGAAAALATFSYVNNSRGVNFYHALPMRRETLFVSQFAVGMLLIVIPLLVVWLILLAMLGLGGVMTGPMMAETTQWLGRGLTGGFVFYTLAMLCTMICGNSLAMLVVYAVFNAFYPVMSMLIISLINLNVFGFVGNAPDLNFLCPFMQVAYAETIAEVLWYLPVGVVFWICALLLYRKRQVENAGEIIAVPFLRPLFKYGFAACLAILLTSITSQLFGIRSFFGYDSSNLVPTAFCLLLYGLLGIIIAQMLLMKSFRIWNTVWRGALGLSLCIVALALGVRFDVTGFERWTPDQEQVQIAYVSVSGSEVGRKVSNYEGEITSLAFGGRRLSNAYARSIKNYDFAKHNPFTGEIALNAQQNAEGVVMEPENILHLIGAHGEITRQREGISRGLVDANDYRMRRVYVQISYLLRNGNVHERSYTLPFHEGDALSQELMALLNSKEMVAKRYLYPPVDPQSAKGGALYLEEYNYRSDGTTYASLKGIPERIVLDAKQSATLMEAVLKDMDEGNIGQSLHSQSQLLLENVLLAKLNIDYVPENPYINELIGQSENRYDVVAQMRIPLSLKAAHTLEALRAMEIPEEYFVTHKEVQTQEDTWYDAGTNFWDIGKDLYIDPSMY